MSIQNDLSKKISKSLTILEKSHSHINNQILVGLSGGKDSLAVYDLCVRVFGAANVVPFHLTFLPNLRVINEMLATPIKKFGIKKILDYPDYTFFAYYKSGMYSWESADRASLPDLTRKMIYTYIAKTAKINKMALGIKKNDNIRMRQQVENNRMYGGTVLPIYDWTTSEVLTYLRLREIEIPKQYYEGFRGIDLNDESLLYLYKNFPDDFEKIELYFPFVRAVIKQYEHYQMKIKIKRV